MKNKKLFMYLCVIVIILIILGIGYLVYINILSKKEEKILEYIPQEEITEEQLRMTNIELYYSNEAGDGLEKEVRSIDAKTLLKNPAKTIIEELNNIPQNENLKKLIPENTKVNDAKIDKGVLYLDLSEDFINIENLGKEKETLIIESIKETIKQLFEINSIKILINGEENKGFKDGEIVFNDYFVNIK